MSSSNRQAWIAGILGLSGLILFLLAMFGDMPWLPGMDLVMTVLPPALGGAAIVLALQLMFGHSSDSTESQPVSASGPGCVPMSVATLGCLAGAAVFGGIILWVVLNLVSPM
ncbi:MAG: hypothetical protein Q8K99_06965 [Actinomycetota bacterium]|nr:hypothetical protein [Actinomycetota bacterium]